MGEKFDVVTIGVHIVDILGRPVAAVPEGQGIALLDEIRMTVAGTAAGTAVDLARLGVNIATIGLVGDDELGRWLTHKMSSEGVDTSRIAVDSRAQTSASMLPIRPNGQRPALHVKGTNALLSLDHMDWPLIESAKYVHVGGSCLLDSLDGEPTAEILRRAQAAGAKTSLDLLGLGDSDFAGIFGPCLEHIDYFLPNDEDALMVSGQSTQADAIRWLHDRGVGATVITLGAHGASYAANGGAETRGAAYAVKVVDTTGCGDAFSAGFLTGLVEGMDPVGAMELGLASGSLVATGLGSDAGLTDRSGLESFMATTARNPLP
ncbi:MAG: hypothetical protein FD127_976 [Acidimicrobiaceae bacterium]|mgnify:CR=1 FL=1|jgi:sugar/nucleoside kinase (ribokinase family)|nr:MAG: hypothetical protein FD127_976 [Acidimicrobiaceae bacterium]